MIKLIVGGYELLQCPFCGGTPEINLDAKFGGGFVYVACGRCHARASTCRTRYDYGVSDTEKLLNGQISDEAFDRAVNAWNDRSASKT